MNSAVKNSNVTFFIIGLIDIYIPSFQVYCQLKAFVCVPICFCSFQVLIEMTQNAKFMIITKNIYFIDLVGLIKDVLSMKTLLSGILI